MSRKILSESSVKSNSKLTQAELKNILDYNPETGVFIWKTNPGKAAVGKIAGSVYKNHVRICFEGRYYFASRLAWLYVHGYFPENGIDHIDRDGTNNRIKNLRPVGVVCNARNCGNYSTNKSGVKGVSWNRRHGKWQVHIKINMKSISVGTYADFDNAVAARLAVEQCVGWSGCDSSSPAYKHMKKIIGGV